MSKSALFVSLFIAYSIGAKPVYGQQDIRRDHVQFFEECSEFGGCHPYLGPIDSMGGWPINLRVEEGEILSSAIIEAGFGTSKQTSLRLLPLGDTFVGVAEVGAAHPILSFSFGWAEVRRINMGTSVDSFEILSSAMSYGRNDASIPPHPITVGLPEPATGYSALVACCALAAATRRRHR